MKNKGYAVIIDALIALAIFIIVLTVLIGTEYFRTPQSDILDYKKLNYWADDSLDVMNKKGILDEICYNWAMAKEDKSSDYWKNASILCNKYVNKLLPQQPGVGYSFTIDDQEICNSTWNTNRTAWLNDGTKTHSSRILIGFGPNVTLDGWLGSASLRNIKSRKTSEFMYFGGFVGNGNITRRISLPNDVNVSRVYLDMNTGGSFDVLVNGVNCDIGNPHTPTGSFMGANINDSVIGCNSIFGGGWNTIDLIFKGDINGSYVGGGYIEVEYTTSTPQEPLLTKYYFPGIYGFINLYSSFYIPGTVRNNGIKAHLHYLSNNSVYFTIGNVTIYNHTGSETEQTIDITGADIWNKLITAGPYSAAQLDENTIPLRFGTTNVSGIIEGGLGTGDSILVTDVSGSMGWGSPVKLGVAKDADKLFVNIVLNVSGNRVGLVSYSSSTQDTEALTEDNETLIAEINTYTAGGATCISCGIHDAIQLLLPDDFIVYDAIEEKSNWLYTMDYLATNPPDINGIGWTEVGYNDSLWDNGSAILGFENTAYTPSVDTDIGGMPALPTESRNASSYGVIKGTVAGGIADTIAVDSNNLSIESSSGGLLSSTEFKVELFGDYDDEPNEHCSVDIEGDSMGDGCDATACTQCVSWDADLQQTIDPGSYCGDSTLTVNFQDARGVSCCCNARHRACLNDSDGNWQCQQADCGARRCSNSIDFDCSIFEYYLDSKAKYWNRDKISFNENLLNDGENVIAVKLINADNDSMKFDLKLEINETDVRANSILVMSDGMANRMIGGGRSHEACNSASSAEAIRKGCEAREDNITVYSVAFGSDADECTLRRVACWNCSACNPSIYAAANNPDACYIGDITLPNGTVKDCREARFYKADVTELADIYHTIAEIIMRATYKDQTIIIEGKITPAILYPDSYIEFDYTPTSYPEYGDITMTYSTDRFKDNLTCIGNISIPHNVSGIFDAKVTSYSKGYWTNSVNVTTPPSPGGAYNLDTFGLDYRRLGDPYIVHIPADKMIEGENKVKMGTGLSPSVSKGCSKDNRAIITILIKAYSNTSGEVFPESNGCNWTLEFEDGSVLNASIPEGYLGTQKCNYTSWSVTSADSKVIKNDATNEAVYRLLNQLDVNPANNKLDILFDPDEVQIDSTSIGHVRSLWGPAKVKLVVWI